MCGIAGFTLRKDQTEATSRLLRGMATVIAHRGPDDEGFFETVSPDGTHNVGLAHRRLSIIDLDTGKQPIGNEDGSVQIVFNGEIYNFKELRADLIKRGHTFKTSSDTETIVHAYEEMGERCVEHFRGMFAFALWDSRKGQLFLARDRFGKKPLYLWQNGSDLLFASEIKSLLKCSRVNPTVNLSSVRDYLSYRYVPREATLFQGITKLPPAYYGIWRDGKFTTKRYYTSPDRTISKETVLPDQPVTDFLDKLEDAVACRMVSDVPFGAFLSGGIDSSAIVGLMARHSDLPIRTFSVGFNEAQYSELAYAKTIADHFATEHHELTISQTHLMDELPTLIRFRDAPVSEPSDIPIYLLSKEARKDVKMVLTGEGSDEILGGYAKHAFERYAKTYHRVPKVLRRKLLEPLIGALPYRFRRAKTAIDTLGIDAWSDRMPRWFGAMSPEAREQLVAFECRESGPDMGEAPFDVDFHGNSALRQILYFDQTCWLPGNLLERGDRMTMGASLEARMPFLDHELLDFVSSLPDHYRIRGRTTKWILREAMTQLLPRAILERPKVGFRVPVNEWFRGPMRDYLYDHLTGANSLTRHYYHAEKLQGVLKEHVSGRQNHEKLLWGLINLEIWHQEYQNPTAAIRSL